MPKKVKTEMMLADPAQMYATVVKNYGTGRYLVRGKGDKEMQCVMRNGVRNAGKRPQVTVGSIVLVSLRTWASSQDTVDLAYVYNSTEVPRLMVLDAAGTAHLRKDEVIFDEEEVDFEKI
jgi:hypothetical protein